MGLRWVLVAGVVVLSACQRDLCADVECRQPATSVCLNEGELELTAGGGACEPTTGECTFRAPVVNRCSEAERCSDGACRCVPSRCAGCCEPNGGCRPVAQLNEGACGLEGSTCARCTAGSICQAGGCVSCPPGHTIRRNQCVDDEVAFDVSLPGSTRWPPPPFDGGITLWHPGPAADLVVTVTATSASANVNGSGQAQLELPVSLTAGLARVQVSVVAPSGRTASHEVTVITTRAITRSCVVTAENAVTCGAQSTELGRFVGAGEGGPCAIAVDGTAWCFGSGGWTQRFADVPDLVDITLPCARSRNGRVVCDRTDGGVLELETRSIALECRHDTCCVLSVTGAASCWGSHPYDLFLPRYPTPPTPQFPVAVEGLPGRYVRLASGEKTFFAQAVTGEWSSATNRMGFPLPAPYVLPEAAATTLKLDSPYYCIMGLEPDGGAWTTLYYSANPRGRQPLDAGSHVFIDFAPQFSGPGAGFQLLTSTHEVLVHQCP